MRCPFLREAQVKYCKASAVKRMIVRMPMQTVDERCSSSEYGSCPSFQQLHEDHPSLSHCPFLHESLVQYCAASPVTKYIPHSESTIIRCGNDNHHYCDLYVSVADPEEAAGEAAPGESACAADQAGVVRLPERLAFTSNHFWIDRADDGICHIGIDGFFAKLIQSVDRINFLTTRGVADPIVMLTARGVDLQCVFAAPMNITAVNSYLRTAPEKLLSHPYSAGWLFEGTVEDLDHLQLYRGAEAREWMKREFDHLTEFLHNTLLPKRSASSEAVMADGGLPASDFVSQLDHEELLYLFNEFFSPFANWRTTSC